MSNKYRARRRKMQSPAVCKKSGPGPIRLSSDQPGWPSTGIIYATIDFPSTDPRGFARGQQLMQLLLTTPGRYSASRAQPTDGWLIGIDADFTAEPNAPQITIGTSRLTPPDAQVWTGNLLNENYLTLSTRAQPIAAGQPDPHTLPAVVKLWR